MSTKMKHSSTNFIAVAGDKVEKAPTFAKRESRYSSVAPFAPFLVSNRSFVEKKNTLRPDTSNIKFSIHL